LRSAAVDPKARRVDTDAGRFEGDLWSSSSERARPVGDAGPPRGQL